MLKNDREENLGINQNLNEDYFYHCLMLGRLVEFRQGAEQVL